MMAPPPRKPTPTTTCDATRVTSIWTSVALRPAAVTSRQPGRARGPPSGARERCRHRGLAMRAPAAPAGPVLAEHLDQLLGDLGEEPAGRVEVRAPEEHAAPRVAEIEPLSRAG